MKAAPGSLADRVVRTLDDVLAWSLVVLMAVMVAVVTWQVATRYVLNSPSSYTEELATYLLIWISLLGTAYALRQKAHLGIDFLTQRLRGPGVRFSHHFVYLMVIVFAALIFVYGGARLVYITLTLNQLSAAFKVPVGYVYTVIPITGVLLVFYSLLEIVNYDATTDRSPTHDPTLLSE